MLLADLKKVTPGIGSNQIIQSRVTKRPIADNQLIRHFRIEKGTGTPHFFRGGSLLGTC